MARGRFRPLAPPTRDHNRQLLSDYLSSALGALPLDATTPSGVNIWFDDFTPARAKSHDKKTGGETARAHAYSLARAVINTAVGAHGPLVGHVNPFALRGGGSTPKLRRNEHVATGAQLATILQTIRPEWRALILFATWTGLRYSEVVALRRRSLSRRRLLLLLTHPDP